MTRRECIDGVDLAFDDQGEGEPVVLLHPFPFNRGFWAGNLPSLTSAGYRVIALDAPGFGDSSSPGGSLSINGLADLVAGLLSQLDIGRATILGLSMGGYGALAFAAKFPDRLAALVLADTRAAADSPAARQGREQALATIRDRGAEVYLDQALPHLLVPHPVRDSATLVRSLAESRSGALIAGIIAMRDREDRSVDLARISCPTLVVVGESDQVSPPAEMRAISEAIPRARFVELPGAGHLSSIEAPASFNQAIVSFLHVVPTTSPSTGAP